MGQRSLIACRQKTRPRLYRHDSDRRHHRSSHPLEQVEPVPHLQTGGPKTPKRYIISIIVPGLGKAENVQSVVTPALTDHIDLVGDGVDVERSTHELTSQMTGMALKVRSDQAIRGTTINYVRDAGRSV